MSLVEIMLEQVREQYPECTDGGDDEHYAALWALGACPWCGLELTKQVVDFDGLPIKLEGRVRMWTPDGMIEGTVTGLGSDVRVRWDGHEREDTFTPRADGKVDSLMAVPS